MRTPKNQITEDEGHMVIVKNKSEVVLRELYPTYGKAMWAILRHEEKYGDEYVVEYRDTRIFHDRTSFDE